MATATSQAKHPEIARRLRHEVLRGQFHDQQRLPNNRELASLFGATPITVRKAVQTLCDQGIVEVRPSSGTFVADDHREGHDLAEIQFLMEDALDQSHPYVAQLYAGLAERLSVANGFGIHLTPIPADPRLRDIRLRHLHDLDRRGLIDGVVIGGIRAAGLAQTIWQMGLPLVLIGRPEVTTYPSVAQDDLGAVESFVQRILARGCRRVHLLRRDDAAAGLYPREDRLAVHVFERLADAGVRHECTNLPLRDLPSFERLGYEAVRRLLAEEPGVDCLLTFGTPLTRVAWQCLCELGRANDPGLHLIAMTDGPLLGDFTKLILPVTDLGRHAGDLLARQLAERREHACRQILLPMVWNDFPNLNVEETP